MSATIETYATVELIGTAADVTATPSVVSPWPLLWVSTDLHCLCVDGTEAALLARDVAQVDDDGVARSYRRLDPTWMAWLTRAWQRACELNRTTPGGLPGYADAADRFAVVDAWARQRYGAAFIAGANRIGVPAGYLPPQVRTWFWPMPRSGQRSTTYMHI